MTTDDFTPVGRRLRMFDVLIALIAGFATARIGIEILGRSWETCDLGVAIWGGLYVVTLPQVTVVTTAWWVTVIALVRRCCAHVFVAVLAVAATGVLGSIGIIWSLIAYKHNPGGDYPAPICPPDNVPPWWPSWIPI